MRRVSSGLVAGAAGLFLLGLAGCSEENEKAATTAAGPVQAPTNAPTTQADYAKQAQSQQDAMKKQMMGGGATK